MASLAGYRKRQQISIDAADIYEDDGAFWGVITNLPANDAGLDDELDSVVDVPRAQRAITSSDGVTKLDNYMIVGVGLYQVHVKLSVTAADGWTGYFYWDNPSGAEANSTFGGNYVTIYNFSDPDATLRDMSGNTHNGIISGSTAVADGIGGCRSHDGVNDLEFIGDVNAVEFQDKDDFTALVYFKMPSGDVRNSFYGKSIAIEF